MPRENCIETTGWYTERHSFGLARASGKQSGAALLLSFEVILL